MSNVPTLTSSLLEGLDSIGHGFFTRKGGISIGEFDSLNCSQSSGDDAHRIRENRNRVAQFLGAYTLYSLKQIHSNKVVLVSGETDPGILIESDAMVTNEIGIALGVLGADCAAVLLGDAENRVVGAAHGGWQGALSGVTDNVIDAMCDLGADKNCIVAAIGPTIQKQSYEVGNEFVEKFLTHSIVDCEDCFSLGPNGQGVYFNLPLYLSLRLRNSGIDTIDRFSEDTYSDEDRFFSYRRSCHRGESLYGRQIGAICIR